MRQLLSLIQYLQNKQSSNTWIGSQIAGGTKFHNLLKRILAKYMLKRNQLIASIAVKMIQVDVMHS